MSGVIEYLCLCHDSGQPLSCHVAIDMSEIQSEQLLDLTRDEEYVTQPPLPNHVDRDVPMTRGGRRNTQKEPRGRPPPIHRNELQEMRGKLAEHEDTLLKLKSAFGMIFAALDIQQGMPVGDHDVSMSDLPANRPFRMSKRGGGNNGNDYHHRNNFRGHGGAGRGDHGGGYRQYRNNAPGFRSTFLVNPDD